MTVRELDDALMKMTFREVLLHLKLREQVRVLIPVLKDHKLENMAAVFSEIVFELDAIAQERDNLIAEHKGTAMMGVIENVLKAHGRGPL